MTSLRSRRFQFLGHEGLRLVARLEGPGGSPPVAHALLAPCFTCGKDFKGARRLSRTLAEAGLAVLTPDFAGLGSSEGDFSRTTFSTMVDDLLGAAASMENELGEPPRLLLGHSLGGTAALAAASRMKTEVPAIAVINSPSRPSHLARVLEKLAPDLRKRARVQVEIGGLRYTVSRELVSDLEKYPMHKVYRSLRSHVLILQALADTVVHPDEARRIYDALHPPRSFLALPTEDHELLSRGAAERVGRLIAVWARDLVG